MSAVALVKGRDGICIAADGITYGDDGVCCGFVPKMHHLPNLGCVIAQVGAGGLLLALLQIMGHKYRSFDELVGGIADDLLLATMHVMLAHTVAGRNADSTIVLAGWSEERQEYAVYRMSNWDKEILGEPDARAYELIEVADFWANTGPGEDAVETYRLNAGELARDASSLCARWVCACRAMSCAQDPATERSAFGVGGFVQVAVLKRDSYLSSIVHRWPDEVGKLIDPGIGELVPDWMMPSIEPAPDQV